MRKIEKVKVELVLSKKVAFYLFFETSSCYSLMFLVVKVLNPFYYSTLTLTTLLAIKKSLFDLEMCV